MLQSYESELINMPWPIWDNFCELLSFFILWYHMSILIMIKMGFSTEMKSKQMTYPVFKTKEVFPMLLK